MNSVYAKLARFSPDSITICAFDADAQLKSLRLCHRRINAGRDVVHVGSNVG
jgi:hypothetical protein